MLSASVIVGSHRHEVRAVGVGPFLGHVMPKARSLVCQAGSGIKLQLKQQLQGWLVPTGITVSSCVCERHAVELGMSCTIPKRGNWQLHQAGERRQPAGIHLHAAELPRVAWSWWRAGLPDLPSILPSSKPRSTHTSDVEDGCTGRAVQAGRGDLSSGCLNACCPLIGAGRRGSQDELGWVLAGATSEGKSGRCLQGGASQEGRT